ncbi:MAG: calcium-binding protein [Hyphomicrobiales bacterium]|nr:calcium-binding protein [Hyphomicrobiales bacterium]
MSAKRSGGKRVENLEGEETMSGLVIFSANTLDDRRVDALYGTDGTADGTEVIADFRDPPFGIADPDDDISIRDLTEFDNGVVFAIEVRTGSGEAWYLGFSDGTAAGTRIYGGGEPGPSGSPYFPVDATLEDLTASGDTLAYIIETPDGRDRLVVVEGGAVPVVFEATELAPDATDIVGIVGNGAGRLAVSVERPSEQVIVLIDESDVDVVATRDDGEFDDDDGMLWSGDTFIYASNAPFTITAVDATNIASTESHTFDRVDYNSITVLKGGIAFGADEGAGAGTEPHFWDLTSAPAVLMGDVHPGPNRSDSDNFIDFNDGILFAARHPAIGEQALHFWDRTNPAELIDTTDLEDSEGPITLPDPGDPTKDIAIFAASEDDKGADVFAANGNPFFTLLARFDIRELADDDDASVDDLFATGAVALFSIELDVRFGVEELNGLYRTDGQSQAGTVQILPVQGSQFVIIAPLDSRPTIRSDGGNDAAKVSVAETTAAVTTVAATAFDSIAYAITGGSDAARFALDTATGELAFIKTPDFEKPADSDGDNVYKVTVEATADGLADTQTLTINVENVDGVTIRGTPGNDRVTADEAPAGQPLPTGEEDVIRGKAGDDLLRGHRGNDDIKGNRGDDTIRGGNGDDELRGNKGKDKLKGGDGDDVLKGNLGGDTLKGGAGDDVLTGGKGGDVFVFNLNSETDIITDFENGLDLIDVTGFGFANNAKALAKFAEVGTANDDQIGFSHKGTTIEINGIDMGELDGSDLVV